MKNPAKVDDPPQELKRMSAQGICQQVWTLMQYIVWMVIMNRFTSNLYDQFIEEQGHPNTNNDPRTWSIWFSNTFFCQESDVSEPTGPRTTPDGASGATEIMSLPTQIQKDTLPHDTPDIKKGAKAENGKEDKMGGKEDLGKPMTATGRPSRKLRN